MKLLLIVNDLSGTHGWSTYARNIIDEHLSAGNEVVACVQNIDTTYHPEIQNDVISMRPAAYLWHPFRIWKLRKAIYRIIQSHNPDVIHVVAEPYVMAFVSHIQIPLVLTIHGSFADIPGLVSDFIRRKISAYLYRRCLHNVNAVLTPSVRSKEYFLKKYPENGSKIYVIPNSCKPASLKDLRKKLKALKVVSTGAVKERKGIHNAIPVLSNWAAERKQCVEYDVIGSLGDASKYVESVQQLAKQHSHEYFRIVFHGYVESDKKEELLDQASLYVHLESTNTNSLSFEGYGIGVMEAATHGVPAIVYAGSATEEAVKDGVSGYVVEEGDESGIFDAFDKVLLGVLQTSDVVSWSVQHSPGTIYRKFLGVYQSLINK